MKSSKLKRFTQFNESKVKKFFDTMPEYQKTDMIGSVFKAKLNFYRNGYGYDSRFDEWEIIRIQGNYQKFYVYSINTGLDLLMTEEELFKALKGEEAKAENWD